MGWGSSVPRKFRLSSRSRAAISSRAWSWDGRQASYSKPRSLGWGMFVTAMSVMASLLCADRSCVLRFPCCGFRPVCSRMAPVLPWLSCPWRALCHRPGAGRFCPLPQALVSPAFQPGDWPLCPQNAARDLPEDGPRALPGTQDGVFTAGEASEDLPGPLWPGNRLSARFLGISRREGLDLPENRYENASRDAGRRLLPQAPMPRPENALAGRKLALSAIFGRFPGPGPERPACPARGAVVGRRGLPWLRRALGEGRDLPAWASRVISTWAGTEGPRTVPGPVHPKGGVSEPAGSHGRHGPSTGLSVMWNATFAIGDSLPGEARCHPVSDLF